MTQKVIFGTNFETFGPPSPEATFDVFLAGRGGPKVKQLRFGAILTKIVGQQHTVIGSKSDFWNKFGDIWAPLPEATFEVLLAARGAQQQKSDSGHGHFIV